MDPRNRMPLWRGRGGRRTRRDPPASVLPNQSSNSSLPSLPDLTFVGQALEMIARPAMSIHTRNRNPDPQTASPLYEVIPPEVRDQIFKYALQEYTKTDPESQYPKESDWNRPGYTGPRAVTVALLQTCRRIYLETYHLPVLAKEHIFWHDRWPAHHERYTQRGRGIEQEKDYFALFSPWQLELVKEIHLFTQQYWLEDGSFFRLTQSKLMQGIEKVKITIRRGDWWYNEQNAELGINPQRGNANSRQMTLDWEAERRGDKIPWNPDAWGCAFRHMKGLKELVMEFETVYYQVGQLESIVEHAKTWRFPLDDGKVLSTEGADATSFTWRGPPTFWTTNCPHCPGRCRVRDLNTQCLKREGLMNRDLGPECTIMNLKWLKVSSPTV